MSMPLFDAATTHSVPKGQGVGQKLIEALQRGLSELEGRGGGRIGSFFGNGSAGKPVIKGTKEKESVKVATPLAGERKDNQSVSVSSVPQFMHKGKIYLEQ